MRFYNKFGLLNRRRDKLNETFDCFQTYGTELLFKKIIIVQDSEPLFIRHRDYVMVNTPLSIKPMIKKEI